MFLKSESDLTRHWILCAGKCSGFTGDAHDDGDVTLDGDAIEKVMKLLYLEDFFCSVKGVQEAVTVQIRFEMEKI